MIGNHWVTYRWRGVPRTWIPIVSSGRSPTRRLVLDRLRERNGQTLKQLCADLGMTRQAVSKHVGVLEDANLVSTARHGREKRHYLNPVPIQQIHEGGSASSSAPGSRR